MLNHQKISGLWSFFVPLACEFFVSRQVAFSGRCFPDNYSLVRKFRELPQSVFGQARCWFSWLNQYFNHKFLGLNCQNSKSVFQIYESFQFFRSWPLFVNRS